MLKSIGLRRLVRHTWRNRNYTDLNFQTIVLEPRFHYCSQYVPLKKFSAQHCGLMKCMVNFSQQTSVKCLYNYEFYRCFAKKKKTSGVRIDESDEDDDEGDIEDAADQNELDPGYKTVIKTVPSLRLDTILKAGLGITSKTLEKDFYADKFRINGEKVGKKSVTVHEGDEIDVVKEIFPENENFLVVNRVVVKSLGNITPTAQFPIKLHVFKALVIENYEDKWP